MEGRVTHPCGIRVLVADECEAFRVGLRTGLMEACAEAEVIEAATAADALAFARGGGRLDVVLVDADLPDGPGMGVCRALIEALPGAAILVASALDVDFRLEAAYKAGASGFVWKNGRLDEIVNAVRLAATCQVFSPRQLARIQAWRQSVGGTLEGLTNREKQVLRLVMEGKCGKQIERDLNVSDSAVNQHVSSLLRKFDVQSRLELVLLMHRHHVDPSML